MTPFRQTREKPTAVHRHERISRCSTSGYTDVSVPGFRQSTATSIAIVILHYLLLFKDSAPVAVLLLYIIFPDFAIERMVIFVFSYSGDGSADFLFRGYGRFLKKAPQKLWTAAAGLWG